MPHWDNIQVGDILQWNEMGLEGRYTIVAKQKYYTGKGWLVSFKSQEGYVYADDYREGEFWYATVVVMKSKEEQVLEKIKYLDKRYADRRVSV